MPSVACLEHRQLQKAPASPIGASAPTRKGGVQALVANVTRSCDTSHMTTFASKLVAEEHHLEDIARDGYAPATLPIVLGAIVVALIVIVGAALGVTLIAYYTS
jgi:hypothetical protein